MVISRSSQIVRWIEIDHKHKMQQWTTQPIPNVSCINKEHNRIAKDDSNNSNSFHATI
jgi:hypothetical protein